MIKLTSVFCVLLLVSIASLIKADSSSPHTFTVTGTGQAKTAPDEVVVGVSIQLNNRTAQQVGIEVDARSADVIAYLKSSGVKDTDIQTSFVTLSPTYSYNNNSERNETPDYYTAQKSLTFTVRNLSAYDVIMTGLYDRGINGIDSIQFQLENATSYQQIARKSAIANARLIAETLMEGLGQNVGAVYTISESTNDGSGRYPVPVASYVTGNNNASYSCYHDHYRYFLL